MVDGSSVVLRQACRVPFCTTKSPGVRCTFGSVVELEPDPRLEHDTDVDGLGRVHAGRIGLHVVDEAGELSVISAPTASGSRSAGGGVESGGKVTTM